jgi:hypothetical protein
MTLTPEMIEAAARAPKHSLGCAGFGKWAINITDGLYLRFLEIFEGDYHGAVARCDYLDAQAALTAALSAAWKPNAALVEEADEILSVPASMMGVSFIIPIDLFKRMRDALAQPLPPPERERLND